MPENLALFSVEKKQQIELDKKAAYCVWQFNNGKASRDVFFNETNKIKTPEEKHFFELAIEKYKSMTGTE